MTPVDENGQEPVDNYGYPLNVDPRFSVAPPGSGPVTPSPRPNRWRIWTGAILAIALVVGSAAFIVMSQNDGGTPASANTGSASASPTPAIQPTVDPSATPAVSGEQLLAAATAPQNSNPYGGITVGGATNASVVRIFVDYNCSHCIKFEAANGADIQTMVAAGTIQLDLHTMAFLKEDSLAAANAAATVADADISLFLPFSMALFAAPTKAGFAGYTDQTLVDVANSVGVPAEVSSRFAQGTFNDWVKAANQLAFEMGIKGTPSVVVGNQIISDQNFEVPNSLKPYLENLFAKANTTTSPTATPAP